MPQKSVPASPHTVLVIDDDVAIIRMLTQVLAVIGPYQVISALNGTAGLEQCMAGMPDLVLIDMCMPTLDGAQVVRALRGDPRTANLPIIMLSAYNQLAERQRGLYAGVDYYLPKPCDIDVLATALRQVFALDAQQRAHRLRTLAEAPGEV